MFMLSGEAAQARAAYAKLEVRPRSAKARTEVQGEDGVRLLCHAIAAAAQGDQGGKDKGIGRDPIFQRVVRVVIGEDTHYPVVVGQVLLGDYGRHDGRAVMQGIIACPFYTASSSYRSIRSLPEFGDPSFSTKTMF